MSELLWILVATILVSLISFIGAATLAMKKEYLKKILLALVGLAAGALIGGAFLHLLPAAIELGTWSLNNIFLSLIIGMILFSSWRRHCGGIVTIPPAQFTPSPTLTSLVMWSTTLPTV